MPTLKELLSRMEVPIQYTRFAEHPRSYIAVELFKDQNPIQQDVIYILEDPNQISALTTYDCCCFCTFASKNPPLFTECVIVSVDGTSVLTSVQQSLQDWLRLEEKKSRIYASLSKKDSVQAITDTLAELTGNPVAVGAASTCRIATGGPPSNDIVFKDSYNRGYSSKEMFSFFRKKDFLPILLKSDKPVLFEKTEQLKYRRILGKIIINGQFAGTCGTPEEYTPFTWDTVLLMETAVTALQCALRNDYSILIPRNREGVLTQLINGEIKETHELTEKLRSIGWRPKRYFALCIIDKVKPHWLKEGFTGTQQLVQDISPNAYLCTHKDFLVIVINHDDPAVTQEHLLRFSHMTKQYDLQGASSWNFMDLMDLHAQMKYVANMLVWCKKVSPNQTWYSFDDCYINGLLGYVPDTKVLCHPGILRLKQSDMEKQTDYIHTLETYLEYGCNAVQTTKALFLHRNSLSHRIAQIEELTGLNLKNGTDIFRAQMSLFVLRFQNK